MYSMCHALGAGAFYTFLYTSVGIIELETRASWAHNTRTVRVHTQHVVHVHM